MATTTEGGNTEQKRQLVIAGKSELPWFFRPVGKRWNFFEFHELEWYPHFLRKGLQDVLAFNWRIKDGIIMKQNGAEFCAPFLVEALDQMGADDILDLASGGGGPCSAFAALPEIRKRVKRYILTDLFPNEDAFKELSERFPGIVTYVKEPVDATACTIENASGKRFLRTMFYSMHHMSEDLLVKIISDCVRRGDGFLALEAFTRGVASVPHISVSGSIVTFLYFTIELLKRPSPYTLFRWLYVMPITMGVITFDGIVTSRRIYSREDFTEIVKRADPENKFEWTVNEFMLPVSCIPHVQYRGIPRKVGAAKTN